MDAKSIILLIVASGCIGVLIGLIPMHFAKQEKKQKKKSNERKKGETK